MRYASCLLMVAVGFVCTSVTIAQARNRGKPECYVLADQPTASLNVPYTPDPTYSFDAKGGGTIRVLRFATGSYAVTCTGVGGGPTGVGGNVQITSYGGFGLFCDVGTWSTGGADFSANVYCFGAGGFPADSYFNLLFIH